MKRKNLALTLEQQRDMLRSLLDQVETQLAPPDLDEVQGPMGGMSLVEQWEYEKKLSRTVDSLSSRLTKMALRRSLMSIVEI